MIEISDKGYELVCDFKAAVMGAHGESPQMGLFGG